MTETAAAPELVIVYGALRSGSTLLRLLLDAHPEISCSGERDFMLDYITEGPDEQGLDRAGLEKDRIFKAAQLDMPKSSNGAEAFFEMAQQDRAKAGKRVHVLMFHRHLGRLKTVFPDARIVHLIRDPRDVARSSIGMGWGGSTWYGVDHWLGTERDWDRHPEITESAFTLRYEQMLETPQETLEALCAFMGLPFSEKMYEFSERSTYSALDASLAYQWRRKQTQDQIADVEYKVGPLLEARGYTPHREPVRPTGAVRKLVLYLQNKFFKVTFNARRYGWRDTLLVVVSNKLRQPGLAAQARIRMEQIHIQLLK